MKPILPTLFFVVSLTALSAGAQSVSHVSRPQSSAGNFNAALAASQATADSHPRNKSRQKLKPLSRIALGVGIGPLVGINMQIATNLCQHANLRATGNLFNYEISDITTNGIRFKPNLALASAGVSLDIYPFAYHGFRLSPGVLLYNTNKASTTFTAIGGTNFTLNDNTYYSSNTNPVTGEGGIAFNAQRPAFTITTGWGNMIPRSSGHWAFPFEVGVALVGAPKIHLNLTGGEICDAAYAICTPVVGNAELNSNLQAQIATYKNDLDPLRTYPIVTFGVTYSFRIR